MSEPVELRDPRAVIEALGARTEPVVDDDNRPFWEGALAGELRIQRCGACGHLRYPVQGHCPRCLSEDATWVTLSGRGEVLARVTYHQAFHPAWKDATPYDVVLVQLDEGPRMFSNILGSPPGVTAVGDRVEAVFERVRDDLAIPRFRRAAADPAA
jgi:uncharacterized OB-fold protein